MREVQNRNVFIWGLRAIPGNAKRGWGLLLVQFLRVASCPGIHTMPGLEHSTKLRYKAYAPFSLLNYQEESLLYGKGRGY